MPNSAAGRLPVTKGIPLLAEVDRQLGLTCSVVEYLGYGRRKASCEYSLLELLKQRVYALALGHEDLNDHGAHTWDRERRVMAKAEHTALGSHSRFVVTNLPQTNRYLYDEVYCARGDIENRIKDQQFDLFADRASSHGF